MYRGKRKKHFKEQIFNTEKRSQGEIYVKTNPNIEKKSPNVIYVKQGNGVRPMLKITKIQNSFNFFIKRHYIWFNNQIRNVIFLLDPFQVTQRLNANMFLFHFVSFSYMYNIVDKILVVRYFIQY